jgi:hypothetical protein
MLVRHKKAFNMGGLLGLTFIGVLVLIFSPVFGGKNGLQFSDNLFNKLSKGSSYFIPKLSEGVRKFDGGAFTVSFKMDKQEMAQQGARILSAAGVTATVRDSQIDASGDLGKMLAVVLKDSDAMYHDNGATISAAYGLNEKDAMTIWWNMLNKMDRQFKKDKKVAESDMISEVMKKGIEPSYNFYGIEAQRVTDKAATMIGLLLFYVAYTMWWGYAIFFMFDGIGLSMKKAKVKKEV